jgi:hypothetical protein
MFGIFKRSGNGKARNRAAATVGEGENTTLITVEEGAERAMSAWAQVERARRAIDLQIHRERAQEAAARHAQTLARIKAKSAERVEELKLQREQVKTLGIAIKAGADLPDTRKAEVLRSRLIAAGASYYGRS